MIALVAALEEETSGLQRRMALAPQAVAGLERLAYAGKYRHQSLLLVCTGMGRQRAEAGARAVLAHGPITAVISIGFSGALVGQLQVGDLVLASELMGITGPGGDESEPTIYKPDQGLLRAATEALGAAQLHGVLGVTVTVPGILATPAGKQDLGSRSGAIAVDMESYWIARVASERGLAFLALRAISDAQKDLLLPFSQILNADGAPRARLMAAQLIRDPGSLVSLLRLARNASRARQALTMAIACTIAAL